MKKKKVIKKLITLLLILAMLFTSMANSTPSRVTAAVDSNESASDYLNETSIYLHLGEAKTNTYDFNIKNSAKKQGTTYTWYVKEGKGHLDSIAIDKKTGIVTAKEAGTAHIRCKVKFIDGTILRPEAKVTVINNITGVKINNIPKDMTITAGSAKDFNRTILSTDAGKGKKTEGITRWEIADDTAGIGSATDTGIVYPIKEGIFKIRAVSFQSKGKYKLWLKDKKLNEKYVTAASEWQTIKVVLSDGKAIANTQEQLNKALASDNIKEITLSTKDTVTFVIEKGNYIAKSLSVDTPNADVKNYGIFKDITIKAIKDTTWIEYANGNIVYLLDTQLRFVIDSEADIKQIVVDTPNSVVNFEIYGKVGKISVLQPSQINLTGNSTGILISVEKNAGGSTISSSIPLDLTLDANAKIELKPGAEKSSMNKSASLVEVKIDNKTTEAVVITTNKTNSETIESGKTGTSNEATALTPAASSTGGGSSDNIVNVEEITVSPTTMTLTATGGAIAAFSAIVKPQNATDATVTWISGDETVATIDNNGVITSVANGTTTILARAGAKYATAVVTVTGSAITATGSSIKLKGAISFISENLAKGAVSYVGGQLMGWGLKEIGLGFKDTTQVQITQMGQQLSQISDKLNTLSTQLVQVEQRLQNQILKTEYDTRVGQMSALIGNINSIRDELNDFINKPIKNNPELLAKSRDDIISGIKDKLINNENLIHNQLVGTGSQEPLIMIWSKVVKSNHRFLSAKDSADIALMYNYYEIVQASMLELMVEYYHAIGEGEENHNNIDRIISIFNKNIALQRSLILKPIPGKVLIDRDQNIMIYGGDYKYDKAPGPWYGAVSDRQYALDNMYDKLSFSNWRLLSINDMVSWVNASGGGSLRTYLNDSGWVSPLLHEGMQFGSYIEMPISPVCLYYDLDSGSLGVKQFMFHVPKGQFPFYWIVCRDMDKAEIKNYFW